MEIVHSTRQPELPKRLSASVPSSGWSYVDRVRSKHGAVHRTSCSLIKGKVMGANWLHLFQTCFFIEKSGEFKPWSRGSVVSCTSTTTVGSEVNKREDDRARSETAWLDGSRGSWLPPPGTQMNRCPFEMEVELPAAVIDFRKRR